MSSSEHHKPLYEIVRHFEALAVQIEHTIEAFAHDESGSVDLSALRRAQEAAQRGANITRNATSDFKRAFD